MSNNKTNIVDDIKLSDLDLNDKPLNSTQNVIIEISTQNVDKMKFIDIGANLTKSKFASKLDSILKNAFDDNIYAIIITGTAIENSEAARILVEKYSNYNLYFTVGIHPHDAKTFDKNSIAIMEKLLSHEKCKSVGETGLDYNRMFSTKEVQIESFKAQIELAIKYKKPLFLHDRDASDDFYNILNSYKSQFEEHNIKLVVHCFTGDKATVKKYLELGAYIGITGWICDERRNEELLEAINEIPEDKLMIETDCPFLSPSKMIKMNEPKYLKYVFEKVAWERYYEVKDNIVLAKKILDNTKLFFDLK